MQGRQGKQTLAQIDLQCLAAQKLALSHGLSGEVHMAHWQVSDAFFVEQHLPC